jgi:hypothetical protein
LFSLAVWRDAIEHQSEDLVSVKLCIESQKHTFAAGHKEFKSDVSEFPPSLIEFGDFTVFDTLYRLGGDSVDGLEV